MTGQQLDVREAHVADVRGELLGELAVRQRAVALERVQPPGARVHLVDRDRAGELVGALALVHPRDVAPGVVRLVDDRGGERRDLGLEREGIGLQRQLAGPGADLELVALPLADVGHEQLPDPGAAERAHRVQSPVPGVEVADDADRPRGGRPDGERRAGDTVERCARARRASRRAPRGGPRPGDGCPGRPATAGTRTGRAGCTSCPRSAPRAGSAAAARRRAARPRTARHRRRA